MDEGFIFYIILAVIALVSQLLKKKKQTPTPSGTGSGQGTPRPQKKPFSFDDILKELQAETLGEPVEEEPVYEPERRTIPAAPVPPRSRKPKQYESYEGLDYTDNEDISEKSKKYKRDDHYALTAKITHPILDILKSEDGAKNAIILSEIINRKYV